MMTEGAMSKIAPPTVASQWSPLPINGAGEVILFLRQKAPNVRPYS